MMLFTRTVFVGVDPTAGKRPFVYAALDQDLRLLALRKTNMEGVLAYLAGQQEAYVAINAPRNPNQGLLKKNHIRSSLSPPPRAGRWMNFRLVEYQLHLHGIKTPRTPARESHCPGWMRKGFYVYSRLAQLGYLIYPTSEDRKHTLETYPHACFCAWLRRVPYPKRTLEGRLQRQLLLFDLGLHIPDPMRFLKKITRRRLLNGDLPEETLHTQYNLDALAAAYTAWLAATKPEEVSLLGDPKEGQVVLPVPELAPRYPPTPHR